MGSGKCNRRGREGGRERGEEEEGEREDTHEIIFVHVSAHNKYVVSVWHASAAYRRPSKSSSHILHEPANSAPSSAISVFGIAPEAPSWFVAHGTHGRVIARFDTGL